jgi:hypothetical protein
MGANNASMRYRLRTLILAMLIGQVVVAALSVNFLTLPLRESDQKEAARVLVAWIVRSASAGIR